MVPKSKLDMALDDKSLRRRYGHLKDIPDEVLYERLQQNESVPFDELTCLCSEILRRQLKEQYSPAKYGD